MSGSERQGTKEKEMDGKKGTGKENMLASGGRLPVRRGVGTIMAYLQNDLRFSVCNVPSVY